MWKRLSHVVHNLQPQAPPYLIRFNTLFHSRQYTSLYNVPIVKNVATQKTEKVSIAGKKKKEKTKKNAKESNDKENKVTFLAVKNEDPLKIRFEERHIVTILYRYYHLVSQQKQLDKEGSDRANQTPLDLFVHQYMKQNKGIGSINRNNISQAVYDMTRWMLLLNYLSKSQDFLNKHSWLIGLRDDFHRQQMAHAQKLKEQQELQPVSGMQLFQDRKVINEIVDWRMKYYIFNLIKTELGNIIQSGELKRLSILPKDLEIPDNILVSCPAELFDMFEKDLGKEKAIKLCLINLSQAPVFLRINPMKVDSRDYFIKMLKAKLDDTNSTENTEGKEGKKKKASEAKKVAMVTPCKHSEWGVRLSQKHQFREWEEYENGLFEIQDEGSQLIANLVNPEPGQLVLDYCAGSGGKTLAFAHKLKNTGQIYMTDIRKHVLDEAKKRLRRAGIQNIQPLALNHPHWSKMKNKMDWVLVDAPCSGTGTLRRNPELKYRITAQWISRLVQQQREIFHEAFQYLKKDPNSRIVYATCSVFKKENEDQIEYFKRKYGLTEIGERIQSLPQLNGYDGMFGVVLAPIK